MENNNGIKKYASLVKFSHTIFAMPFAFIGFFLAVSYTDTEFNLLVLFLIILCMVFARNAAMAFNRYADREIDKRNPRTALREIPAGILNAKSVLWFVLINSLLFIGTTYFINPLTFYLSPIALVIVLGYSLSKRISFLSHLILGLGLSLAPIGAYLSLTGAFELAPLMFSFVVLFWVSGFDIIYALQDEDFDKKHQLSSIPARFGPRKALRISAILHILSAFTVIGIGVYLNAGLFYSVGAALFIGLLIYQHTQVKPNDLSRINLAFFTANGMASIIFALFVVLDFLL